ncbi:hypothetical protein TTHERM_00047270 (macronuclear) [Tetrahymena thermophila SB210]|uniref:Uncharacterized protein n=1 Tax=Tetrahymena thermophila (strain SB210) TaxID=312017 RepID=Q23DG4_TETTS|nr:hypothetical protein TTHERM_00047270 [Tetrahymena thermophila SB210]EAR94426.2 hypothetical protein TTHERM_00047270 [Tetrahymena thermophila SB210]|eukprot:XP_001014722.2 hypothetical protein TTHERM_00047270 [Tetrahymena thermophila SB210]
MLLKRSQGLFKSYRFLCFRNQNMFCINTHVYNRQNYANLLIEQIKEPLIQRQQELLKVEETIQNLNEFEQLQQYVKDYQSMVIKQKENIDDLMEYYVIVFLQKLTDMEREISCSSVFQQERSEIINVLNDIILKYLNNFSKESLLVILNFITESPIDDKRKFFRIFEFAIARTQFVMKMKEEQLSLLLQKIEKLYKKGYLQQDIFIELIEKIEFSIVEQQLKDFEPADLASVAYIYSTHYQGTEVFFYQLKENLLRVLKQMNVEQQVVTYWSLVNSGYFSSNIILPDYKIKWILNQQNELKIFYKLLITNAYTQQKHLYQRSITNIFNSLIARDK